MKRVRQILEATRVVAVLGATPTVRRAGFYVAEYLRTQGYQIHAVNPRYSGQELFGRAVVAKLIDIAEPVDLVDVFRRPEMLPGHLEDILAMSPLPRVVWFQLGIRHDAVAARLEAAGIEVVQDRCTLADHRSLGLGRSLG